MSKTILAVGLALTLAWSASATVVTLYSGSLNTPVPDNSVAGATFNTSGGSWNSTPDGTINSINVLLDINGGYNGDLYGYLVYSVGGTTVSHLLLNRVGGGTGTATAATVGFGGAATASFGDLQTYGVTLAGSGAGGGIQDTPAVAGSSYTAAGGDLNNSFTGLATGGTWTLFLADVAAGDHGSLVSWGLSMDVTVVPEPATGALIMFGGAAGLLVLIRRRAIVSKLADWMLAWLDVV